uniref:Protein-lysine N-trimethyltransferase SMYD5 n=1 Tax=Periophthalmus magnuspinnatus TaxID=409849 RepID=A0A3B3ZLS6_9GOBI
MAAPVDDMFSLCTDPVKVSSAVEIRFIDHIKGKGLFAKKTIKKGEAIFIERPLVSAQFLWNALYKYKACEYCLRALETAEQNARRLSGNPGLSLPYPELCKVRPELHQPCPQCQVMYCSSECRQAAADQYHRVLCLGPSENDPDHPINKLKDAWRSIHYPPETSSIMLMAKMVAAVKQGQLALLHSLFTSALFDEHLSRWFIPEGFRSLFALVGTNGQGIGTSSLSQWVHACDALELPGQQREQLDSFIDRLYKDIEKETGDFLNCEGSGLFILQSTCNHSCIPNAEASFPDNNFRLHLTALCDISPGEEICISYLDCCQRDRSRHSRHKILRENYLFVCACPKCVSQMEELDVTSEEEDEEEGEAEGETEGDEMEDEMTDV